MRLRPRATTPDVLFDWDDPTTHARALDGVDRVSPVTYAGPVSDFLDSAAKAEVRHVHMTAGIL